jgi:hypothetical protein
MEIAMKKRDGRKGKVAKKDKLIDRVNVPIKVGDKKRIDEMARRDDISAAEVVRRIIADYLSGKTT